MKLGFMSSYMRCQGSVGLALGGRACGVHMQEDGGGAVRLLDRRVCDWIERADEKRRKAEDSH